MSTARVRVLLADDHPLFRQGLRTIIAGAPDLEVVAEAATGVEAVSLTHELEPDVVLMDLHMPELGGLEATRRILEQRSDVRVLVLTMIEQDAMVLAALQAGARGYLLKGADRDEVLRAVRGVAQGDAVLGAAVADRLSDLLERSPPTARPFPELTDREHQVLELIASGSTNAEIAAELELSLKTVRNNVSNVLTKLRVAGRAQAIVKARDAGLGRAPP
jgi:DNA-binding NarL/FixJ family response regulator